ncbi:MAG: endonuclease/exonuclease/phosphatase family protein [Chitinophagales bacterium]
MDFLIKNKKTFVLLVAAVVTILNWSYISENWEFLLKEWEQQQSTIAPQPNANYPNNNSNNIDISPIIPAQPNTPKETNKSSNPSKQLKGIKIVSWNLYNIGISKDDSEVEFIANLLKNYHIIAIQEISTKLSGPRAVVKLNDELGRKNGKWDYVISDPTIGPGSERYAYLWRTDLISLSGRPWLSKPLQDKVDREPFMARFKSGENTLLLGNFHAVPTSKKPQTEIQHLVELHRSYRKDNLLIMGDFNLSQKHEAFSVLKQRGYSPILVDQKTSLRRTAINGDYLAQEYDNLFYSNSVFKLKRSGIIDFVSKFESLKAARSISDHMPIWCELSWASIEE